jgi:riboflavin kinase / FMN adenylyltransferase
VSVTLARRELSRVAPGRPCGVTIGVFDGVHRGHQHLVGVLLERARAEGLASVALTFNPHPRTVIRPGTAVTYLTSLEERVELLQGLGLDAVGVLAFTSELAQLSAEEFLSLLVQELEMRLLVVGPDFALGRNRAGTIGVMRQIGARLDFRLEVAPLLAEADEKVGSSAIRQALSEGDVARVGALLGRPFSLRGPVVSGDRRGRTLGFPTANIAIGRDRALPAYGALMCGRPRTNRVPASAYARPSTSNQGRSLRRSSSTSTRTYTGRKCESTYSTAFGARSGSIRPRN